MTGLGYSQRAKSLLPPQGGNKGVFYGTGALFQFLLRTFLPAALSEHVIRIGLRFLEPSHFLQKGI